MAKNWEKDKKYCFYCPFRNSKFCKQELRLRKITCNEKGDSQTLRVANRPPCEAPLLWPPLWFECIRLQCPVKGASACAKHPFEKGKTDLCDLSVIRFVVIKKRIRVN